MINDHSKSHGNAKCINKQRNIHTDTHAQLNLMSYDYFFSPKNQRYFSFFNEEKFRVTSVKSLKKICVSMNLNWSYIYNTQTWTALIYLPVSKRARAREKERERAKKWIYKKILLKSSAAQKNIQERKNDEPQPNHRHLTRYGHHPVNL